MIIFNERQHFENLIENGFEKYPNKRDLTIIGKYWLNDGISIDEIKVKLVEFCKLHNEKFNYAKSENMILSVVENLRTGNIPEIIKDKVVELNTNEINEIKKIKDLDTQVVAFVILCLAKWNKTDYIYLNTSSLIKVSDIFALSNLKLTKEKQYKLLHELNNINFIDIQIKPFLKCIVPVLTTDYENNDIELKVNVNEELYQSWLNYVLPNCLSCGKGFIKMANSQKYCKECALKIKRGKLEKVEKVKICT